MVLQLVQLVGLLEETYSSLSSTVKKENIVRQVPLGHIRFHFILDSRHEGTGAKGLVKMYVKNTFTAMLFLLEKTLKTLLKV